jgi:hypothetical protein
LLSQELRALYEQRRSAEDAQNHRAATHVEMRLSVATAIRPSSDVYYGLPKDLLDRGLAASADKSQEISDIVRDIMRSDDAE